ncbi:uncharacterized protein UTRI_06252 [Ustilago trichophora]|uniref:Uncharacterized protein n=1 Tax=Ustilago trichophora TaxID=86804 RepID=A0A5C3EF71_9BASI|nr:uncharacterized protein UTRI_06252 [Ustilago trichophora]
MAVFWPSLWLISLIIFAFMPVILAARYENDLRLYVQPVNHHYAFGTLQHYSNDLSHALSSHHPHYDSAFTEPHSGLFPLEDAKIEEILRAKGDTRHIILLNTVENPKKGFAVAFPVSHPGEPERAKSFAMATVYPFGNNGIDMHVHGLSDVYYTPNVEHYIEKLAPTSLMPGSTFSTAGLAEELRWIL